MRMFRFQLHPLTPVEDYTCADDTYTVPSSPSSSQSSPESCDFPSRGRWQNGRRHRHATRNIEQRPYHSPNHISPPHDKPMTKNDMYFALDCEVSYQLRRRLRLAKECLVLFSKSCVKQNILTSSCALYRFHRWLVLGQKD